MSVGILVVDCLLGDGHSLKEKRRVLLSLTQKIRNTFNVSVAEVDHQNLWQRSQIAVVGVNTEWQALEGVFSKIISLMQRDPRFTLLNFESQKLY